MSTIQISRGPVHADVSVAFRSSPARRRVRLCRLKPESPAGPNVRQADQYNCACARVLHANYLGKLA